MDYLSNILVRNAINNKDSEAFFLLDRRGEVIESISNDELWSRAVSLSKKLSEIIKPGERAILVFPTSIKFIETFFACVLSGVVPVPICPPRNKLASWGKVSNIVSDCDAKTIIFDSKEKEHAEWRKEFCVDTSRCMSLDYEDLDVYDVSVEEVELNEQEIAFIQYSSGSTSFPKGVVVTHKNIIDNQITIKREFGHGTDTRVLSWLPHYHDMGLVGSILQSVFLGVPCYLIASSTFVNNPLLWLECISRYKITTSGGPNFGYQLCLDKLKSQASYSKFDLGTWKVAFSGSEPVKNKTIEDFSEAFEKHGFSASSFYPCYGLAEATLFVSGRHYCSQDSVTRFKREDYDIGRLVQVGNSNGTDTSVSLVSCGRKSDYVRIVKPDIKSRFVDCKEGEIGEICVTGANVSQGYFGRIGDEESGFILDQGGGAAFRTGDLGSIYGGNLFVTGRTKDLIIIRGANYYPHDIEVVAQKASDLMVEDSGAAVGVGEAGNSGAERVVLIQEARRNFKDKEKLEAAAISAVAAVNDAVGVTLDEVIFVRFASLAKTSSGKLRRAYYKKLLQENNLEVVYRFETNTGNDTPLTDNSFDINGISDSKALLRRIFCRLFKVSDFDDIADRSLSELYFDSLRAFQTSSEITSEIGARFEGVWFLDGSTPKRCIERLYKRVQESQPEQLHEVKCEYIAGKHQTNIWLLQSLNSKSRYYNLGGALRINDAIDVERMSKAIKSVVKDNDILRTVYSSEGANVLAHVTEPDEDLVEVVTMEPGQLQERFQAHLNAEIDLATGPVARYCLYQGEENCTYLSFVAHHICIDQTSIYNMLDKIFYAYSTKEKSEPSISRHNPFSYSSFCEDERNAGTNDIHNLKGFWRKYLENAPALMQCTYDYNSNADENLVEKNFTHIFNSEVSSRITSICKKNGVTPFVYFLSVYKCILSQFCQASDVVVGVPMTSRPYDRYAGALGCFVDVKPVRTLIDRADSFYNNLVKVRSSYLSVLENRALSSYEILNDVIRSNSDEAASHNSRFMNVRFSYASSPPEFPLVDFEFDFGESRNVSLHGVELTPLSVLNSGISSDLNLAVFEGNGAFGLRLDYDTSLFHSQRVESLLNYIKLFVETTSNNVEDHFVNYFSGEKLVSVVCQNSPVKNMTLVMDAFRQSCRTHPTQTALVYQDKSISFEELAHVTNKLANFFIENGVVKGDAVALEVPRSENLIILILSVLKCGGAYVIVPTEYPEFRKIQIVQDVRPRVFVFDNPDYVNISLNEGGTLLYRSEDLFSAVASYSATDPNVDIQPDDVAYILYTSGTTGKPKGILGLHRGIANRSSWMSDAFSLNQHSTVLHCTPFNYVRAERELFYPLYSSSRLILACDETIKDPYKIFDAIAEEGVTHVASSPTLLNFAIAHIDRWREKVNTVQFWFLGAEVLSSSLADRLLAANPTPAFIYFYGSTETSSDVLFHQLKREKYSGVANIPVGKPIPGCFIHIVDEEYREVMPGSVGELVVSGMHVSGGYLNNKELTERSFIPNPFGQDEGSILYKTGDYARYLVSGDVQIIGRKDGQVKIDGVRIELSEIEKSIMDLQIVDDCIVLHDPRMPGRRSIIAFLVFRGDSDLEETISLVEAGLAKVLPRFMLPAQFRRVYRFPLTALGKIDRNQLLREVNDNVVPVEARLSGDVARVRELISIVLGIKPEEVDISRNFFDQGGNSLLLASLLSEIKQSFSCDWLDLSDLYVNSTAKNIAHIISRGQSEPKRGGNSTRSKRVGNNFGNFKPRVENWTE